MIRRMFYLPDSQERDISSTTRCVQALQDKFRSRMSVLIRKMARLWFTRSFVRHVGDFTGAVQVVIRTAPDQDRSLTGTP